MAREINFYFATLNAGDALWLAWRALVDLLSAGASAAGRRDALARDFAAIAGGGQAFPFPSARAALLSVFRSLGCQPGDEVLVTGFTCVAVPNAVAAAGLRPVYVDIDDRFCTDPAAVASAITPRTRALVVQHTYGIRADVGRLVAIARRHGLHVIEDCAQALGEPAAPVAGDAAVFSFELSKPVTTGWGGIAVVKHEGIAGRVLEDVSRRVREAPAGARVRMHVQTALSAVLYHPVVFATGKYVLAALFRFGLFHRSTMAHEAEGRADARYDWHMTGPQASLARRQLRRLPQIAARRRVAVARYAEAAGRAVSGDLDAGMLLRYPVRVADPADAVAHFAARGIELGRWFNAPVAPQPSGAIAYTPGSCPRAEHAAAHIVNLPTHPRLSDRDIDRIAAVAREYLERTSAVQGAALSSTHA